MKARSSWDRRGRRRPDGAPPKARRPHVQRTSRKRWRTVWPTRYFRCAVRPRKLIGADLARRSWPRSARRRSCVRRCTSSRATARPTSVDPDAELSRQHRRARSPTVQSHAVAAQGSVARQPPMSSPTHARVLDELHGLTLRAADHGEPCHRRAGWRSAVGCCWPTARPATRSRPRNARRRRCRRRLRVAVG